MYKKSARKYHPDVSEKADATAKFQGVSEAYEVLKNKEKRAEYDELREYVNNSRMLEQDRDDSIRMPLPRMVWMTCFVPSLVIKVVLAAVRSGLTDSMVALSTCGVRASVTTSVLYWKKPTLAVKDFCG